MHAYTHTFGQSFDTLDRKSTQKSLGSVSLKPHPPHVLHWAFAQRIYHPAEWTSPAVIIKPRHYFKWYVIDVWQLSWCCPWTSVHICVPEHNNWKRRRSRLSGSSVRSGCGDCHQITKAPQQCAQASTHAQERAVCSVWGLLAATKLSRRFWCSEEMSFIQLSRGRLGRCVFLALEAPTSGIDQNGSCHGGLHMERCSIPAGAGRQRQVELVTCRV